MALKVNLEIMDDLENLVFPDPKEILAHKVRKDVVDLPDLLAQWVKKVRRAEKVTPAILEHLVCLDNPDPKVLLASLVLMAFEVYLDLLENLDYLVNQEVWANLDQLVHPALKEPKVNQVQRVRRDTTVSSDWSERMANLVRKVNVALSVILVLLERRVILEVVEIQVCLEHKVILEEVAQWVTKVQRVLKVLPDQKDIRDRQDPLVHLDLKETPFQCSQCLVPKRVTENDDQAQHLILITWIIMQTLTRPTWDSTLMELTITQVALNSVKSLLH